MSERGLELSAQKTLITSIEDGFNFLGYNLRQYDRKLLIKPDKPKVLDFCRRIGQEIKSLSGSNQEAIIRKFSEVLLTTIEGQLANKPSVT
jgi:RNA-directed DNA polymerase